MKKIIVALIMIFSCILLQAQPQYVKEKIFFADSLGLYLLTVSSEIFVYSGGAIVLIIVGYLVYRFFRNTEEKKSDFTPVIKKVSPNPSHGPVVIQIDGKASQLKVFDANNRQIGGFAVTGGELHFDFTSSPRGHYTVIAYYGATQSNAVHFSLE